MKIKNEKLAKKSNLIFYISILIIPVTQFIVFYVGVNFNSFILSFQRFEEGKYVFNGIENFKQAFFNLGNDPSLLASAKNSILYFCLSLLFSTCFALMFSYYIYKKKFASGFLKMILFLPSIISSIVLVVIFKYLADRVVPFALDKLFGVPFKGLIADPEYTFGYIIFYNLFISFGANLLVYTGTMKDISESVVEAAQLDGITSFKEFLYITLPSIYPTLVTFLVAGIAGIFTNQLNLFSFFGETVNTEYQTFGYYMYAQIYSGTEYDYPYLATLSLLFSFIAIPITLVARWLLTKYGPSDN